MTKRKLTKRDKLVFIVFLAFFILAVPLAYLGTFYSAHKGTHSAGTIIDGKYYYGIAGKGVYAYTPGGESKRIIKNSNINGDYIINRDGIYQKDNKMIYFYDFETEKNQLFFDAGKYDCSHINMFQMTDGNINIARYSRETDSAMQLIVKSKTGEVIVPETDYTPYKDFYSFANTVFYIGDRQIVKKAYEGKTENDRYFLLEENGQNILPEGTVVEEYTGHKSGDCLVFDLYTHNYAQQYGLLLLRANGNDKTIDIPNHYQWSIHGDYAYSISNYQYSELQCIDIHTGESWVLNDKTDVFAADITTDGNHIYTREYHPKSQTCWKIIKDQTGKPIKAVLVTEKI